MACRFLQNVRYVVLLLGLSLWPGNAAKTWTVLPQGAGPIRIGMTLAEARRALGDRDANLAGNLPGQPPPVECSWLQSKAVPKQLGVMFANGRVVRVDVRAAGIRTAEGAAVGDTETRIRQLYPGRITVDPHKYEEKGHSLTFWPNWPKASSPHELGILFETDGSKVTRYRAGRGDAIALVEGCG